MGTIYELHFTVGKFTGTHTIVHGRNGRRVSLADRETEWFVRVFSDGEVSTLPETRKTKPEIEAYAIATLPTAKCRAVEIGSPSAVC